MRSKIFKKAVSLGTAISIICCLPQFSASAANDQIYFKCELKGDLSKCTYAITSDVVNFYNQYGQYAINACKAWSGDYKLFDVNWLGTSGTSSKFTVKFVMSSDLGVRPKAPYAKTKFYSNVHSDFDANVYDWTYCFVLLNRNYGIDIPQSTFTHEIGHVLGLAHQNNNPNSIMCQEYYGRVATEPSSTDRFSLTLKYKNRTK